jgi:hypothetical protein
MSHYACAWFLRKQLVGLISMVKLIPFTKTPLLIVVIGVVKWSEIQ